MGIYFIAAGNYTKNRQKTLDKPNKVEEICRFLSPKECDYLRNFFHGDEGVYVWGANHKNLSDLSQIRNGEYVVDVKNKEVVQVFKYCFFVQTQNTRLQEFLGWDSEKKSADRRPYHYIYFLKSPRPTKRRKKGFFQAAFNLTSNPQWLIGQKYFNDSSVLSALECTSSTTVENFLGIASDSNNPSHQPTTHFAHTKTIIRRKKKLPEKVPTFEIPMWLRDIVEKIKALKSDPGHLERDHEDLVASFFEKLGYERIHDIKFRRGNIDIRIEKNGTSLITIEVKADWNLSPDSRNALNQAYNYALETGTPYVIITNGERYCIYDRRKGMSYTDNLASDITLTNLTKEGINYLELLRKSSIK